MKNLYLIPTDKPSRVYKHLGRELKHSVRYFEQKGLLCINQHIYITSDEEIKEGNYHISSDGWFIDKATNEDLEIVNEKTNGYRKIILATDQDLIKDGVQAIDDEFLEWFVENPSCEEVEVKELLSNNGNAFYGYKIIIPKEEKTFVELLDDSLSKTKVILEELKLMNAKREKLEEDTEKLKELWKISEDKDLGEFIKGGKYIQQDGVIILAGENKTDGIVITDHKNTRGIGYYSDCWNPKAFKLYEEPKPYTKWEQDKDKYSEEDMVKFSSWILLQDITSRGEGNYVNTDGKIVTVKDLFEQFKKK